MESLPDDAIFNILVRLPAKYIYEVARLVCSRWFHLTRTHDFARAHLYQSTHRLLIQDNMLAKYESPILVGARSNGRIEISNFNHYKFKGRVMSSCNGLILEEDEDDNRLFISNPATKQQFALPKNTTINNSAIAYAAATKKYKVVCAVYDKYIYSDSGPDGIAILTVGVDKDWTRRVDIQHLSLRDKGLLKQPPLATQGFVHWAERSGERVMKGEAEEEEEEFVLTLNVENEAITKSRVPPCLRREGEKRLWYYYLSTGSRLSVLIGRTVFSWELWVMEAETTGEWTQVMRVDLEGQVRVLEKMMGSKFRGRHQIAPVGWSKFGGVLVFGSVGNRVLNYSVLGPVKKCIHTGFFFAYNVCTHEIESFELDPGSRKFVVHRNSLVWLN